MVSEVPTTCYAEQAGPCLQSTLQEDDYDNFLQYDSGLASKLILKPLQSLKDGPYAFSVRIEEQNRVGCEAYAPSQAVAPVRSGADLQHQTYF